MLLTADIMSNVMDFLVCYSSPSCASIIDIGHLRLVNRMINAMVTEDKGMTPFWFTMLRRTTHTARIGYDCYRAVTGYRFVADLRAAYGECKNSLHHGTLHYLYDREGVDANELCRVSPRTRDLYTEWRVMAYKRIGRRTWNAKKERQLARAKRLVEELQSYKKKHAWLEGLYHNMTKSENRRVRRKRDASVRP